MNMLLQFFIFATPQLGQQQYSISPDMLLRVVRMDLTGLVPIPEDQWCDDDEPDYEESAIDGIPRRCKLQWLPEFNLDRADLFHPQLYVQYPAFPVTVDGQKECIFWRLNDGLSEMALCSNLPLSVEGGNKKRITMKTQDIMKSKIVKRDKPSRIEENSISDLMGNKMRYLNMELNPQDLSILLNNKFLTNQKTFDDIVGLDEDIHKDGIPLMLGMLDQIFYVLYHHTDPAYELKQATVQLVLEIQKLGLLRLGDFRNMVKCLFMKSVHDDKPQSLLAAIRACVIEYVVPRFQGLDADQQLQLLELQLIKTDAQLDGFLTLPFPQKEHWICCFLRYFANKTVQRSLAQLWYYEVDKFQVEATSAFQSGQTDIFQGHILQDGKKTLEYMPRGVPVKNVSTKQELEQREKNADQWFENMLRRMVAVPNDHPALQQMDDVQETALIPVTVAEQQVQVSAVVERVVPELTPDEDGDITMTDASKSDYGEDNMNDDDTGDEEDDEEDEMQKFRRIQAELIKQQAQAANKA